MRFMFTLVCALPRTYRNSPATIEDLGGIHVANVEQGVCCGFQELAEHSAHVPEQRFPRISRHAGTLPGNTREATQSAFGRVQQVTVAIQRITRSICVDSCTVTCEPDARATLLEPQAPQRGAHAPHNSATNLSVYNCMNSEQRCFFDDVELKTF